MTSEYGEGFDELLIGRRHLLTGIRNGIDTEEWNPVTGPHLPAPFSDTDLSGKRFSKWEVFRRYGLEDDAAAMVRPMVGIISRMVEQKGSGLVCEANGALGNRDIFLVILGTGERRCEESLLELAARYPARVGVGIAFDEELAHLIEGDADIFLTPSRFEPCGLNQMYSMRYDTVTVVRSTGGLVDTVHPFDPETGEGNGFTLSEDAMSSMLAPLDRALSVFRDSVRWRALQLAGIQQDFSWELAASAYVQQYKKVVDRRCLIGLERRS